MLVYVQTQIDASSRLDRHPDDERTGHVVVVPRNQVVGLHGHWSRGPRPHRRMRPVSAGLGPCLLGAQALGSDSLGDLHPTGDTDFQAPDGHELVAAVFDAGILTMNTDFYDAPVSVRVEVGDERTTLDGLPQRNETVVVAAPEDAPVLLVVVDDGGRQSIDLRTGERIEEIALSSTPISART